MHRRSLAVALLVSVLLHLTGLTVIEPWWRQRQEMRLFRARLGYSPRFAPPVPAVAPAAARPREMEYVPSRREPVALVEALGPPADAPPVEMSPLAAAPATAMGFGSPGEAPAPRRPGVEPSPTGPARVDTSGMEARELLRIEDLARADNRRAVIVPDPTNRRDLRGFINFTLLKMDGVGCDTGCSQLVGDLARYMRDHTRLLARIRGTPVYYFQSENLLKDPVHFFFRGARLKGDISKQSMYMSEEEVSLLGRYLRGGGLIFAETELDSLGDNPAVHAWFSELITYVRAALAPDGRLVPLSPDHRLYQSFYSFPGGFPLDRARPDDDGPRQAWYYPKSSVTLGPRGLYGVELEGELVAVLSDLGLHQAWAIPGGALGGGVGGVSTELALRAGVNLVVYALTRDHSLVPRRAAPAWIARRSRAPGRAGSHLWDEPADSSLQAGLPAHLALIHSPLGERLGDRRLEVVVSGQVRASVWDRDAQAVLLQGLEAGPCQVRITFAERTRSVNVRLRPGQTATLSFGLDRLLFLERLRLRLDDRQVQLPTWLDRFSDLELVRASGETYDDVAPPPRE